MVGRVRRTAGIDAHRLGGLLASLLALGALALATSTFLLAGTAGAAVSTRDSRQTDTVVVVTGDVRVSSADRVDNVIVVNGDVRISGVAEGDVFVVNGNVIVDGRVRGDVTSLNGRVTLGPDAFVGGDVVSKDPARVTDGAHVGGEVARARDRFALGRLGAIGRVFLWIAATVSSFVLGAVLLLFAPRGMDSVAGAGRTAIGPAIGLGLAVVFGVPFAGVLLAVTVLGLPLGLAVLLALALLYGIGYAAGALIIGRTMVRAPKSRWLAFLAGWALLRVIAVVPVLGVLVLFATVVYGLGSVVVSIHRSQRSSPGTASPGTASPALAPPSPPETPATSSAPATPSTPVTPVTPGADPPAPVSWSP